MNKKPQNPYFFAGVTAFLVIAAAILVFFAVFHFKGILSFLSTVNRILRPIYYGSGPGFPVAAHPPAFKILTGLTPDSRLSDRRNLSFLNAVAIILSLLFAALVIYILLAMVLPQVYESVVGLVQSIPGYFMTLQERLMEFLANNPDIQTAVMPYYNSVAVSVESGSSPICSPIWSPSTALCPGSSRRSFPGSPPCSPVCPLCSSPC